MPNIPRQLAPLVSSPNTQPVETHTPQIIELTSPSEGDSEGVGAVLEVGEGITLRGLAVDALKELCEIGRVEVLRRGAYQQVQRCH